MSKARRDGLVLLFLGASLLLLLLAYLVQSRSAAAFEDFKPDYYATRTLLQRADPYSPADVLGVYRAQGGARPNEATIDTEIATRYVYPPTAFLFLLPFALLPWGPAHFLWMALGAAGLILAALAAWDLGADYAPILAGALSGFVLANSLVITVLSNPSEIAIAFCVVGVWCFLRNRYVPAGILCLALSLALKPQDAGLVWLYFLLAGSVHRRRALQTLLATLVFALPGVLWTWIIAPHWLAELQANILAFSARGGLNDPGPTTRVAHTLIDLQVILALFRDDPRFYNPVSYLVIGALVLVWAGFTFRAQYSVESAWLALAAITPLSLLPVHHHLYDTKLLLLLVPAACMLAIRSGVVKAASLIVAITTFAATGDISGTLFFHFIDTLLPQATGAAASLREILIFPVPLVLLAVGVFYLVLYARSNSAQSPAVSESVQLSAND